MDWYPLLYFPAHRRDLDLRDLLRGDLCRLLYRKAAADPQRHSGRYVVVGYIRDDRGHFPADVPHGARCV